MNMKARFLFVLSLTASLLLAGFTIGSAQDAPPPDDQSSTSRRQFDPARFFQRMDANSDGAIESSEFRGPEEMFKQMDADGDGKVTQEEFSKNRPQFNRGDRGQGGRGPNLDRLKEELGLTDEEWTVLKPRVEKASERVRVRELDEAKALEETLKNDAATSEDIKAKLDAFRAAKEKAEAERKTAQDALKELVSTKQEAVLVLNGILD